MAILTIKNTLKELIKLIYIYPGYTDGLKALSDSNPKIVLIGTPAHGNLGDQAIAISEMDFLKKSVKGKTVVEVPMPLFKVFRKRIRGKVNTFDTIVISGGGWMGNLWVHNEISIREVVKDYPNNRIIIFPQTLYYTDDEDGEKTLQETKTVLSEHNSLYLTVRDDGSIRFAKRLGFKEGHNLMFCPDMVAFATLAVPHHYDNNVKSALLCLRNDVEKKANTNIIANILSNAGYTVKETSTVLDGLIPINKRIGAVQKKIDEFKMASIVVTDRLHAMLFSVLAGTPCIALDNRTGKVFGAGNYLKKSGLPITLVDTLSQQIIINADLTKKEFKLSEELEACFSSLASIVNNEEKTEACKYAE